MRRSVSNRSSSSNQQGHQQGQLFAIDQSAPVRPQPAPGPSGDTQEHTARALRPVEGGPLIEEQFKDAQRLSWFSEIAGSEPEDISYLHAGLCMAALPHRRPRDEFEPWTRTNGSYRLTVTPGWLTPEKGEAKQIGIPYGTKARLLLLYIMGEAVRNRSPVIPMQSSMSAWMRSIGLAVTGGANGTIRPIREQALRVSQCGFQLRIDGEEQAMIRSRQLVSGLQLWKDSDGRQEWTEEIELDKEFFEHLIEHAVPLDERAIARLKGSSMALDLYAWLCHRLPRLSKPVSLRWDQLEPHFGVRTDKREKIGELVRKSVADVLACYPDAKVEIVRGGIRLHPSAPAVPHRLRLVNTQALK